MIERKRKGQLWKIDLGELRTGDFLRVERAFNDQCVEIGGRGAPKSQDRLTEATSTCICFFGSSVHTKTHFWAAENKACQEHSLLIGVGVGVDLGR